MILALLLAAAPATAPDTVPARVERILARAPVIDGHNDLAWELRAHQGGDVTAIDRDGSVLPHPLQTDLARLRRGHVGGQFWSVWIPPEVTGPRAVEMTLEQIDLVRRMVDRHPRDLALAGTAADMRRVMQGGRIVPRASPKP